MTYIKPETAPNQSLTVIPEILRLGTKAAQQQDWLSVNNHLKQLPQAVNLEGNKEFVLDLESWHSALDLAILLLMEADFQHKWSIIKLLPLFGNKVIPTLTTLVKDIAVAADIRWFGCQTLGNFNDPAVVLTLVELIDSTADEELIAIAGKTLTKIGDDAVDALQELSTKAQHRFLAVKSLYYIRTAKTIEPLISVVKDPEPELRAIAIEALGSFHDERIYPVLINALQDKASNVRKQAALALGFRSDINDDLDLTNHLRPLLFDLNLEVCRQAAVSLGRLKNEAATTALYDVLQAKTTPTELKLDLVKALGWSEISLATSYLGKALLNSTAVVSVEIITVLGRTSVIKLKSQAAKVLVDFWQSKSPQLELSQIKQALATSWGELGCNCGIKALKQLNQDSDRKIQLYAAVALKKIDY